ncbi:hypothetical protein Tco_0064919 [Tanacetum coccineum]
MLQDVKSTWKGVCYERFSEAAYILGIRSIDIRSRRSIGLCQSAYSRKILKRFHMEKSKRGSYPGPTPMQDKLKLSKSQGASTPAELKRMQNVPYASAVGSIIYDVRCTRLDVAFAQNITSRFQQNPGFLGYTNLDILMEMLMTVNLNCICGSFEWRKPYAIAIANESGITKGARHFRAKVHYLREVIEFGDIKLEKVHTDDNLADPFTKALAFPKHSELTRNIGMLPASSFM